LQSSWAGTSTCKEKIVELSHESADALVRGIGGSSAAHLGAFVESLIVRQYSVSYVCQLACHALAFGRWREAHAVALEALSDDDIARYQCRRSRRRSRSLETRRRERHALELVLYFLRGQRVCPIAPVHETLYRCAISCAERAAKRIGRTVYEQTATNSVTLSSRV
jgi:hypothetical protein